MFRNQSAHAHQFSMIPRADIPRSKFRIESAYKTTFDSDFLVPFYVDEVLPGDSHSVKVTAFARLATPIVPFMDNLHLETFFFFVPNRLVWDNWQKFMGEQKAPGDSISFTVPQCVSAAGGFEVGSLQDYFGLPTEGQVDPTGTVSVNALPMRAYALIFNEWFRDQNLVAPFTVPLDDGPDEPGDYSLRRRGKRHDYFTSCLPWTQKGTSVSLPLGTSAPVVTGADLNANTGYPMRFRNTATNSLVSNDGTLGIGTSSELNYNSSGITGVVGGLMPANLYADLSAATAATINQIRQAFQIQKLLERDARGGTRYSELLKSHFGVTSPDARLQRPEYLGGGHTMISVSEIQQNSATLTGETPLGTLSAKATATAHGHGFRQSFTEHGYVIGLINVRSDITYQQGTRKLWSRNTRYDFYWPVFSQLGEQAVNMREIYTKGTSQDDTVFGYQERWAEYRYMPSQITGGFRSTSPQPLDIWHLAENFSTAPALNEAFINSQSPVFRVLADGSAGNEFLLDCLIVNDAVRPLPAYSVPGLVDHF